MVQFIAKFYPARIVIVAWGRQGPPPLPQGIKRVFVGTLLLYSESQESNKYHTSYYNLVLSTKYY